jgi:hypothetical protein
MTDSNEKCTLESCDKDAVLVAWGRAADLGDRSLWLRIRLCREHFDSLGRFMGEGLRLDPFQAEAPPGV